jgi:hypothetical protein
MLQIPGLITPDGNLMSSIGNGYLRISLSKKLIGENTEPFTEKRITKHPIRKRSLFQNVRCTNISNIHKLH